MAVKKDEYKFKFSVVVPIYNVEKYIEETIKSIINQTIDFEKNIQLILVNDGSPDNSEEICLKYKNKYPENVVYVKQENAGVSCARNTGMKYIEGKYVNFLDSDDIWEENAFKRVWTFFEKNYEKIDIVACRLKYFGVKNKYHFQDYKFEKDQVVDVFKNYDMIQCHMSPCFFKSEKAKNIEFEKGLKYDEDALYVAEMVLEKGKIGFLRSVEYGYRKRDDHSSALDNSLFDKDWYFHPILYYNKLIKKSLEEFGRVIPYIQYQIIYDLQWKFKVDTKTVDISKVLTDEEKIKFISGTREVLQNIDDNIIIEQKDIFIEHKFLMLKTKYEKEILNDISIVDNYICHNDLQLFKLNSKNVFQIIIMDIKEKTLEIEGKVKCIIPKKDYELYLDIDEKERKQIELQPFMMDEKESIFGELIHTEQFKMKIPISYGMKFKFILKYKDGTEVKLKCNFGKFAKLNRKRGAYYKTRNYIITQKNDTFFVRKNTKKLRAKRRIEYFISLVKAGEFKIIAYRFLYGILSKFIKRPIWIISDRTHRANDNGMHLFKYVAGREKKAKVYFLIDKKSDDYKKMKEFGKVLKYNSLKYKLYFLLSSKIISSQADDWVINAFGDKQKLVKDLYNFDFIFLQHGITKDDISGWLNKYQKNIRIFVTCATDEYNSIIENKNYLYTEREVKLLGFPRYDNLKDKAEKKIVFMPTWRQDIANSMNEKVGSSEREYSEYFKTTKYFEFYNKIINDKKILEAMKNNGYTGRFCIHPSFEKQYIDFEENDLIKIEPKITDYQKEFSEGSLLITDFSSVAFDFAYLRKPVIYTQFDADTFFEGHLYDKGYFEYERDGFGPVCYDYDSSVEEIVRAIENGCKLEDIYSQRINKFYLFKDKDNCKRVYEEILRL